MVKIFYEILSLKLYYFKNVCNEYVLYKIKIKIYDIKLFEKLEDKTFHIDECPPLILIGALDS